MILGEAILADDSMDPVPIPNFKPYFFLKLFLSLKKFCAQGKFPCRMDMI
jgi:hypothetical protein